MLLKARVLGANKRTIPPAHATATAAGETARLNAAFTCERAHAANFTSPAAVSEVSLRREMCAGDGSSR